MICINCGYDTTSVKNSRTAKKEPRVWRRRYCTACKQTFTTNELPALEDMPLIKDVATGNSSPFSVQRLAYSLATSLRHSSDSADSADDGYWLARQIASTLRGTDSINGQDIRDLTHETLERFDPVAGLHYATSHGIVQRMAKPRRGRPRLRR